MDATCPSAAESAAESDTNVSPSARALFALHAEYLERSPVFAHWAAAGVSTCFGCTLAAARGAWFMRDHERLCA